MITVKKTILENLNKVASLFGAEVAVVGGAVTDLYFGKKPADFDVLIKESDWDNFDMFAPFSSSIQYNEEFNATYFGNYDKPLMISRSLTFNVDDLKVDVFLVRDSDHIPIDVLAEQYIVKEFDQYIKMCYYTKEKGAVYSPEFYLSVRLKSSLLTEAGIKDLSKDVTLEDGKLEVSPTSRILDRIRKSNEKYGLRLHPSHKRDVVRLLKEYHKFVNSLKKI